MQFHKDPVHGFKIDARHTMYPSQLEVCRGIQKFESDHDTTFGIIVKGNFWLEAQDLKADIGPGTFFAIPGRGFIESVGIEGGMAVTYTRYGYRSMQTVCHIEEKGRLSYIDGCSDSILVHPGRLGDACLNHLHFPTKVVQTQHTHPSIRLGVVIKGRGIAWRGMDGDKEDIKHHLLDGDKVVDGAKLEWSHQLTAGGVFILPEQELHSFCTTDSGMDIIAFHPDSDWGPTDEVHPMLNRTHLK